MFSDLETAVRQLGLDLAVQQVEQLISYRDRLAEAARDFNLTSEREPARIEVRHILESLAFGCLLERCALLDGKARVLDIGSGAGLPGIPLKISRPDLELVLLESNRKKARFLEDVTGRLGLPDVQVAAARAEDFGRDPERRQSFDLVVARAVAPLAVLLEYALPCLRLGGHLAAPKGSAADEEIDAASGALLEIGAEITDVLQLDPPGGIQQSVVLVRKAAPTPQRYPRRPGMPAKRPLA